MSSFRYDLPQRQAFVLKVPKDFVFDSIVLESEGRRPVLYLTAPEGTPCVERMFSLTTSPDGPYYGVLASPHPPVAQLGSFTMLDLTLYLSMLEGDVLPREAWSKDSGDR
jgi:hypothetical protein